MKVVLTIGVLGFASIALAQSFSNMNFAYGLDAVVVNSLFGSGVSAIDFDQDGDDDLTFALNGEIKFFRNDQPMSYEVDLGVTATGVVKHVVWVDADNDGDLDLFFTQYNQPNKFYINHGGLDLEDITEQTGLAGYASPDFGCSWGDYDRDGDLDLFVCTYVYSYQGENEYAYSNHLYRNEGSCVFTDVTLDALVSDGISVSFQSIWMDYNNDGWQDLYVINDKEHPNRMYQNNQDGTFSDVSFETGSSIAMVDAMSASTGDYDNDGDLDIYVSNTSIAPCVLLQNNGDGTFDDVAAQSSLELNVLAWGGIWFDPDLDGDVDLYVCEHNYNYNQLPNPYMRNNGFGGFNNVASSSFPFDYSNSYSGASCDWSLDGSPDLAVSNISPQNASLWINSGSDNQFFGCTLKGVISNSQGVGAIIHSWVNELVQTNMIHCGENYLGQNSNRILIGLGQNQQIDSLNVLWPSGVTDTFFGLPAGFYGEIEEGSSYAVHLTPNGAHIICPGDSIALNAGLHLEYLWNTQNTIGSIFVSTPGNYSVTTTNEFGFTASDSVLVSWSIPPEYTVQVMDVSCFDGQDGSVEVNGIEELGMFWLELPSDTLVLNLSSGTYQFQMQDSIGCIYSDSVDVWQPELLFLELDEIFCNEFLNAQVTTFGGTPPYDYLWSDNSIFEDLIQASNSAIYSLVVVDQNNCSAQLDNVECPLVHRALAQNNMQLYPTPVTHTLHMSGFQAQIVRVKNCVGEVCLEVPFERELDLSSLTPGVYYIQVQEGCWRIIKI